MQASRTWHLDWLFFMLVAVCASDITSFTDAKCTRSWRSVDTVNGYPDGLCKPLNVTAGQSFQVQQLDPGCAGMVSMVVRENEADECKLHCMAKTPVRFLAPVLSRLLVTLRCATTRHGYITRLMDVCRPRHRAQNRSLWYQRQLVHLRPQQRVQQQSRRSTLVSLSVPLSLEYHAWSWVWQRHC